MSPRTGRERRVQAGDFFGYSVSLDGDNFVVGTKSSGTGKAYSGTLKSLIPVDTGNTSQTISRISFVSREDGIVGWTTDNNQGSSGDPAEYICRQTLFLGESLSLASRFSGTI